MDWLIDTTRDDSVARGRAAVAEQLERAAFAGVGEHAAAQVDDHFTTAARACAGRPLHVRLWRSATHIVVRFRVVEGDRPTSAAEDGVVPPEALEDVRGLSGRDLEEVTVGLLDVAGGADPGVPHLELALSLPRETVSVPIVRGLAAQAMRAFGVTDGDVDDVQVAITEACANVIKHADAADTYEVRIDLMSGRCTLTVVDTGVGFEEGPAQGEVEPHAESGRGLALMRALVDNVAFRSEPRAGAVVRMVKTLHYDDRHPLQRR